ncbi:MAG: hypothetical protein RJA09_1652 [Pseudomonadota bacterium]|jgi:2-polyprenyl-6-methoxyphenol hydroxylase-like FAD-dependent oxidoreductase
MSKTYDVAVLGAGVTGLTLALLLAQSRLRVALVGRPAPDTPLPPDTRAYALNHRSQALLASVRAWPDGPHTPPAVTPVAHMWVNDAPENTAVRFTAPAPSPLAWIVDVPALETALAQAVSYQPGIDRLDTAPNADLTAVCEGRRSQSRALYGFEYDTRPFPHTAVASRLRCEKPHGGVARQWFLGGDILALLPMEGPGGNLVALVWSVPHERATTLLATAPDAFAHAVQVACDQALGHMALEGPVAAWPLEQARARQWTRTGVALVGDAAHAMHPLAGQGLNVGLADVAELAQVVAGREYWRSPGDARLLRRYERARQADVATMGWATEQLFGLFGHTDPRVTAVRRLGLQTFDKLAHLKRWTMHHAMGRPNNTPDTP